MPRETSAPRDLLLRIFLIPALFVVALSSADPSAAGSPRPTPGSRAPGRNTDRNPLSETLGRNETRIYAAPFVPALGSSIADVGLVERLDQLGYRRVHERPDAPGEYFWGHETFWMFRRGHRDTPPRLVGWRLQASQGRIVAFLGGPDTLGSTESTAAIALEPLLLGTSFDERRARSTWVALAELPESVWRALLAIEDARFFDHLGIDGRAVARALLANVRSGQVVQGGSTITQQLIKLRDLSPKRSLGRKASEALRALALESEHSKEHILEAYLNLVYYGHVEGLALYGIEAAARSYYSVGARSLSLAQGAALAALVQGPNRLSPLRHPELLATRFRKVLDRLEEMGWAPASAIDQARREGLPRVRPSPPRPEAARAFRGWLRDSLSDGNRPPSGIVETTLDGHLQALAEDALRAGLDRLRRAHPKLRGAALHASLVALDATTGEVLAYVGGDPAGEDEFDRARRARRQPGSTVKPFVVLEALVSCGRQPAVFTSRRVVDRPLTVSLESGDWSPRNADQSFRGIVTVRQALTESLNVPIVRIGRHCGFEATAKRFRRAGLDLPKNAPPAFVLGAVETSALELAGAYGLFVNGGRVHRPRGVKKLRGGAGSLLRPNGAGTRRAASPAASYLVYDLLRRPELGPNVFGKTGTSSERRDAWYAGGDGRLVATVWVGLDDNRPLELGGATAAEPIWRSFVLRASPSVAPLAPARPQRIVEHWIHPPSGLRQAGRKKDSERYLFNRRHRPPTRRWWRRSSPLEPIE